MDSNPLYGWTVIVYPFFSSVDIWVGFSFCLLWEMMSGSECIKIFMWWYVFISLVKIPRSGIADVTFFFFCCAEWHVGSYFSEQGLKPCPLHWKCRVLTTGPLGKSLYLTFKDTANWFLKYMYHLTFPSAVLTIS